MHFGADDLDAFASNSARLQQTLTILEQVAHANEKALIFVEDLVMQERLAGLIQQRFKLPVRPMRINGTVPGFKRQELVEAFQSRPGSFEVMILSPRAGGVGLTLTAANHVIHLSRWWNPAEEDQATDRVFRIGQTRDVHVYLPMAVHPDPAFAPSSFDLRLDALLERKRKLTRDLFLPPEVSNGELGELFREVSLEQEIPTGEPASAGKVARDSNFDLSHPHGASTLSQSPVVEDDAAGEEAPSRPAVPLTNGPTQTERTTLSLPRAVADAQIKMWRLAPGEPRPKAEILSLFNGRNIAQVTIRDPYALASHSSRQSHIIFLRELKQVSSALDGVLIEYAPEAEGDRDDGTSRREFGSGFGTAFAGSPPKLVLSRRSKRAHDDDFHDRFIEIDVRQAGGAIKRHSITIGRGVEALYNERRQCTVTYVPPGLI